MGTIANEIQRLQNAKASIKTSIENKGVVVPSATKLDGYSTLIDQISQGTTEAPFNDVNFYDYDGTRLYSYTKQEFLALNEMPANPTHDGLTSQGWNWSLSGAKNHLNTYGYLDIGQLYITDDGATRIYVDLDDEHSLSPYVGLKLSGTLTIDWGDNSSDTITGTNYSDVAIQHTYSSVGSYIVRLIPTGNSSFSAVGGNNGARLFGNNTNDVAGNYQYCTKVTKIEGGRGLRIGSNMFYALTNMETITIPKDTTYDSPYNVFAMNYSLKHLTLPDVSRCLSTAFYSGPYMINALCLAEGYTSYTDTYQSLNNFKIATRLPAGLWQADIYEPSNLRRIAVSITDTNIRGYKRMSSLSKIKIPANITSINSNAFEYCDAMTEYDFTSLTAIPTLGNADVFNRIHSYTKIVVPDSLYNSWITASNWANYASYIIKESDYNA